jgi:hypothetical protein
MQIKTTALRSIIEPAGAPDRPGKRRNHRHPDIVGRPRHRKTAP